MENIEYKIKSAIFNTVASWNELKKTTLANDLNELLYVDT